MKDGGTGIRTLCFLDPKPDPSKVPDEILALIHQRIDELSRQWNERFPRNPVAAEEDDDVD